MAETDSADGADGEEEERESIAWASQTPHTRIVVTPQSLIYAGTLDDTERQNGTSFGLVADDIDVVKGAAWRNSARGDDETTAEAVDEGESRPTDFRIVDEEDRDTTIANGALVTDENGPNTYDESSIEEQTLLWYNGMSGERLSRVLDFNGRPFARWTDDGYLVKGLYQVADGWRGASGDTRSDMKSNGKAPRVARAPILRQRVNVERDDEGDPVGATVYDDPEEQRLLIDMSRFMGGRGYEIHVFDADSFEEEFGSLDAEIPRTDEGYAENDIESALDMSYCPVADDVLDDVEYAMHMYTGEGFQNEPEGWQPQPTSNVGSFGVSAEGGDEESTDGLTAEHEQFVREVVDELKGSGLTPAEAFEGGLSGLIGKYSSDFSTVPDADQIREETYARVGHLDVSDLDE